MQSPSCQLSGELLECWLGTSVFELNKIIQKYENRNVLFLCFSLSLYWKGMVIFLWEALSQFFTIFQASTKFFFFFFNVDYLFKSSQEPHEGHILLIFI